MHPWARGRPPSVSEWLWGRRVVNEVLRGSNRKVDSIWIERGLASAVLDDIRAVAEIRGVDVVRGSESEPGAIQCDEYVPL